VDHIAPGGADRLERSLDIRIDLLALRLQIAGADQLAVDVGRRLTWL
jgi:hypothetical protein